MLREVRDGARHQITHGLAGRRKELDLFSKCSRKPLAGFETEGGRIQIMLIRNYSGCCVEGGLGRGEC